jgi:hypothetical protein
MPATDDHGTLRRLAVRANLVWLAGHQRDVAAREARAGKALTGMPVHRSTAPTLPGALNMPDLSGDIARKLTELLRELLDRDWTPNVEADTEVKRWLQGALRWDQELWTDHEVLDWYDDTTDLRRRAERVLGPDAHGRWLGPCPVPDCVGEVRMGDDQAAAVCAQCGGFVTREQQHAYILEMLEDVLMTVSGITTALKTVNAETPYPTVQSWTRPRGYQPPRLLEHVEWAEWMGFPFVTPSSGLYRFGDAFTLAAKRATRVRLEGSAA